MKFIFVVLAYNQEDYILEHLESIKYQIEKFGKGIDFKIIIADDGSADNTVDLASYWTSKNEHLFCECVFLADRKNKGTCDNFTKTWDHIDGDYCKVSAADDVYSQISLFDDLGLLDRCEIMSGLPLMLIDDKISLSRRMIYHMLATEIIYRNRDYLERLEKIHIDNTPNMLLPVKVYSNESLRSFVRKFFVTEDFPMHVRMAQEYAPLRFIQLKKILVFYRRTESSTYLVRKEHFNKDKVEVFNYMILNENNVFRRLLLKNRVFCYTMKNRLLSKVLNLSYYVYFIELLVHYSSVIRAFSEINPDISEYQAHMNTIAERAQWELNDYLKGHLLPTSSEKLAEDTVKA